MMPGATPENLFASDCKGSLDGEMLKKLGLTRKRMEEVDALFFYQLLLPICTPQKSDVDGDWRRGYYEEVTKLTSLYALLNELDTGAYGHHVKLFELWEMVHFDGVVLQDGVQGRSNGALANRWLEGAGTFDSTIVNTITHRRWLLSGNQKYRGFPPLAATRRTRGFS